MERGVKNNHQSASNAWRSEMSEATGEQIEALKKSIAALETQRNTLGDKVVEAALIPLCEKLAELAPLHEVSQAAPAEKYDQQRKQVTLLFTDIVGSTSIIQNMDPEDVSEAFDVNL
jgi:class 3 adenylate cyclase